MSNGMFIGIDGKLHKDSEVSLKIGATLATLATIFSLTAANIATEYIYMEDAQIQGHETQVFDTFKNKINTINGQYQKLKQHRDKNNNDYQTQETLKQLDLISATSYADPTIINKDAFNETLENMNLEKIELQNLILGSKYIGEEAKGELLTKTTEKDRFDKRFFDPDMHNEQLNECYASNGGDGFSNNMHDCTINRQETMIFLLTLALLPIPMFLALSTPIYFKKEKLAEHKKRLSLTQKRLSLTQLVRKKLYFKKKKLAEHKKRLSPTQLVREKLKKHRKKSTNKY